MGSVTDELDKKKEKPSRLQENGVPQRKVPSGKGDGKWQTNRSLADYRKARDAKKKLAKANRKRNKR